MGRVSDETIDLPPNYGPYEPDGPDEETPTSGDAVGAVYAPDTRSWAEIVAEHDASIPF